MLTLAFVLLLLLTLYTAFFVAVHAWFLYGINPDYHRAFKLSRGIAAAILTSIGIAAAIVGIQHWDQAYLYRHYPEQSLGDLWMWHGMLVVLAHIVSDFLWMLHGRLTRGIIPRNDLVIHHGVCLLAFCYALWKDVGFAVCLIALVSELMPVTSGLGGWGQHKNRPDLIEKANVARLRVLVWWRRPLWFIMAFLTGRAIFIGKVEDGLEIAFGIAAVGFTTLIFLDKYWIKKCS